MRDGLIAATAAALLAFAGSSAAAEAGAEARADPRLGPEIDRICFQRNINGWRELKGVDNVVLLETGVNDWHRVELAGACRASLFRFAQTIGIESRPGGGCVTRGDVILVGQTGGFVHRCIITKINKWDIKAPAPEASASD